MLTPTVVRTWAPRGQTPWVRHSQRHDRISGIPGISVSPRRCRPGLHYLWHHHNLHELEVVAFLRHLLRHLRGSAVLIWDRLDLHRGKPARRLCRRVARLRLEFLPAYAPQLNPDEGVGRLSKKRLPNGCPGDRFQLARSVIEELESCRRSPSRLCSCITRSGLRLGRAHVLYYLRSNQ